MRPAGSAQFPPGSAASEQICLSTTAGSVTITQDRETLRVTPVAAPSAEKHDMALFGKILAGLNIVAAIAFLCLAGMDWGKRTDAEYQVFRAEMTLNGLPLD